MSTLNAISSTGSPNFAAGTTQRPLPAGDATGASTAGDAAGGAESTQAVAKAMGGLMQSILQDSINKSQQIVKESMQQIGSDED